MVDAGKPNVDFARMFAEVQANRNRLDACPRHKFDGHVPGIEQGVAGMMGKKITCLNCGGQMDLVALNFYLRGFEAAGGNGNTVLPGWKEEPGNGRQFFKAPEDD